MRDSGNPEWKTGDVISQEKLNNIEEALKAHESVSTLPEPGTPGRLVRLTTDNKLYLDVNTSWVAFALDGALSAHLANMANPHGTTPEQINAVNKSGDVMDGPLTLSGDPTEDNHAATKAYVDSGKNLTIKKSVRCATTGNITLSGLQTIDGIVLQAGDRVLVKNQTTARNNGIYVVKTGAWERAEDANTSDKVISGMIVFVKSGTKNANSGWILQTSDPITLGTTSLSFTQVSGGLEAVQFVEGLYRNDDTIGISNGGVTDAKIGNRTADQNTAPPNGTVTASLTNWLSYITNRLKAITGTDWWSNPVATISQIWGKFNQNTGHGHTGTSNDGPKLDPTKSLTYVPVSKAGDSMSGALKITGGVGQEESAANKVQIVGGYGSQTSGRIIMGDGTGWQIAFAKRDENGAITDVIIIDDKGGFQVTGTANFNASPDSRLILPVGSNKYATEG